MAEEKKGEPRTLTLKITLPTKETVVKAVSSLFPGIEVEVEEEKPTEETSTEET